MSVGRKSNIDRDLAESGMTAHEMIESLREDVDSYARALKKSEAMYWRFRQIAERANDRLKASCGDAAQRANDTEAEILSALHEFSTAK